jgi:Domain of unknown function (DUF4078)
MSYKRKDADLYGQPRAKKLKAAETSNSLSFSSQLSSLISSASTRTEGKSSGRSRPQKDDIFSVHNKNAKKRALKDLEDASFEQKHSTTTEALDHDVWRRSQRKMEDKARLYAAMKRGDVEDADEKYAVDFDRKWAESKDRGDSDAETSEEEEEDEETVEYIDEFGRTRTGTRGEAAREEARKNRQATATDEMEGDRFKSRPNMPTSVIYGNTIQSEAFNPEADVAAQQAELAAKRDKSLTPPPDEHFDGRKEFRTRGVGFFQFSTDIEERKRQMDELQKEREETERKRDELAQRQAERKREIEERKKAISERRSKARADKFLDDFEKELNDKAADAVDGPG